MDILSFLDTLENTLAQISVRGKADMYRMSGTFQAIDEMRESVRAQMTAVQTKEDTDGRQTDIRPDSGNEG